jgi:hypothetical protein
MNLKTKEKNTPKAHQMLQNKTKQTHLQRKCLQTRWKKKYTTFITWVTCKKPWVSCGSNNNFLQPHSSKQTS